MRAGVLGWSVRTLYALGELGPAVSSLGAGVGGSITRAREELASGRRSRVIVAPPGGKIL
ncbi:hypothetical protein UFOVP1346_5 [uncultured Caudovirales phage]|uniref:Uncharacterized protein n=1 Tax=uncultured Caudovirales phage TaxID=2100421 RepID=A0A6J5R1B7_9CAUD|nr:hypothetical protein UFOVP921_45 [uncultured Caudovirales phage]CAB4187401.1 hypothetical protein UFOVP1156_21 [uncultured Caudovirales phage]CAB4199781.1 hypothetical protein UFOVP1346_5 [uncultured Caudovirales phage]